MTVPFVWRAVSSAPAPAGYNRATLYLFQPLQHVDPGSWTGYQLTDDAIFTNSAHPMSQATYADAPLVWPNHSMPAYWDGLYQLRMVFSAPDKQPWTSSYPAAVIKVSGERWTLVAGGGSSCSDGNAESVESIILPRSKTQTSVPPETLVPYNKRRHGKTSTSSSNSSHGGGRSTRGGGSQTAALGHGGTSGNGGGSSSVEIAVAAVAGLALASGTSLVLVRRRRRVS